MERTEVVLGNVRGEIQLFSDNKKAGKMDISVIKDKLTVYHTEVNEEFETSQNNLFVLGDGSGVTHSLSQASASGVEMARILNQRN